MSEFELKTSYDFNGPISDLIQVTKACEKAGLGVQNMINVLKRPDKKAVLKEINEYAFKKKEIETQRKLKAMKEQNEKETNSKYQRPDFSDLLD